MPEDEEEAAWAPVDTELFSGRKIQAIKLYREASGVGLKEAKDACEAREIILRERFPQKFSAPARSGCFSAILLFAGSITYLLIHRA